VDGVGDLRGKLVQRERGDQAEHRIRATLNDGYQVGIAAWRVASELVHAT
jgi:hypothetical protein